MNCPNCNTENTGTSKFCIKCGTALKGSAETLNTNNSYSEKLIIIGLGINFFAFLIQSSVNFLIKDWTNVDYSKFSILLNLIYLAGGILIAIALSNKKLKIIGIILVLLPHLFWIIANLLK